jgi:hypothetical protein
MGNLETSFMLDDDSYMAHQQAIQIINQIRQIEKVEQQLKYVQMLINSLTVDSKENFRDDLVYIEKFLLDPKFLRELRERDAMVIDYAMEYFGKDFGDSDPFLYKDEFERKLVRISFRVMEIAGRIVQELKSVGEFEIPTEME